MSTIKSQSIYVGVIGGEGQLGRWCAEIFRARGNTILISDRGTSLSNRDLASRADIIVVAVPISVTAEVLAEIKDLLHEGQLLVDMASVKTPFVPIVAGTKAEVVLVHPMFAPSLSETCGQTCVVCPIRTGPRSEMFERVFRDVGLRLVSMSPDAHDRTMAFVQGLTHFQALASAHCMAHLGFQPSQSLSSASPIYRMRLAMIGRILAQNPRLYAEIQIYNPYVQEVLEQLTSSHERLMKFVVERDIEGFAAEFERTREALGSFSRESLEESSRFI